MLAAIRSRLTCSRTTQLHITLRLWFISLLIFFLFTCTYYCLCRKNRSATGYCQMEGSYRQGQNWTREKRSRKWHGALVPGEIPILLFSPLNNLPHTHPSFSIYIYSVDTTQCRGQLSTGSSRIEEQDNHDVDQRGRIIDA